MLQPQIVSAESLVASRARDITPTVAPYLVVIAPMVLLVFQVLHTTIKRLVAASTAEQTDLLRRRHTVFTFFW